MTLGNEDIIDVKQSCMYVNSCRRC